jgi:MPBQ/MSBQ methyltransferase
MSSGAFGLAQGRHGGLGMRVRVDHAAPLPLGRARRAVVPRQKSGVAAASSNTYGRDLSSAPRLIQHKNEAKEFYKWLSLVYDTIVNPGHWTAEMRDDALEPAQLDSRDLKVGECVCVRPQGVWWCGVCGRVRVGRQVSVQRGGTV